MPSYWFWSAPFPLSFIDPVYEVGYQVVDPNARVEGVFSECLRRPDGSTEGWRGMLIIRDKGEPSNALHRKTVIVASGVELPCELPKDVGPLIGRITSDNGASEWFIFRGGDSKPVAPSVGSTPSKISQRREGSSTSAASPASGARPDSSRTSPVASSPDKASSPTPEAESPIAPEVLWPV